MRRSNGTTLHGQTPGFLGAGHSSFAVDQSLLDEKVEIEALKNPAGLDGLRLTDRANLRKQFNSFARELENQGDAQRLDPYFERAVSLLARKLKQPSTCRRNRTRCVRHTVRRNSDNDVCWLDG